MRLLPLIALLAAPAAWAVPQTVLHQARLLDSAGDPIEGDHTVRFRLFDAETGGTQQFEQSDSVDLEDGYLAVQLGPIPSAALDKPSLYVEIALDGTTLGARLPLVSVPYALRAGGVTGPVDATAIEVGGSTFVDGSGNVSAGDIDAADVYVDTLSVGGTTVITEDGEFVGSLLGGALSTDVCDADAALVYDGSAWGCGPAFPGTVSWLDLTDRPTTLSDLACAPGQVPTATSSGWTCSGGASTATVAWLKITGSLSGVTLPVEVPLASVTAGWTWVRNAGSGAGEGTLRFDGVELRTRDAAAMALLARLVTAGPPTLGVTLEIPDGAGGRAPLLQGETTFFDDMILDTATGELALGVSAVRWTVTSGGASVTYDAQLNTGTGCATPPARWSFVDPRGRPLPTGDTAVAAWGLDLSTPPVLGSGSGGAGGGKPALRELLFTGASPAGFACAAGDLMTQRPVDVSFGVLDPTSTSADARYASRLTSPCSGYVTQATLHVDRDGARFDGKAHVVDATWTSRTWDPDTTTTASWSFVTHTDTDHTCP